MIRCMNTSTSKVSLVKIIMKKLVLQKCFSKRTTKQSVNI